MASRPWTNEEKALIQANPEMEAVVLAEKLGRTYQAVNGMRQQLNTAKKPQRDYDIRPSGWYLETVGTLLMEFEDAWESWKHYHRYVQIRVLSSNANNWTLLLCRRDADAP